MINVVKEVYGDEASYRESQLHFLSFYEQNRYQNIVAEMPTGSGKSLLAMTIAMNHPNSGTVFIVTPTKDLMYQYERDFGNLPNVLLLAGKNEYYCLDSGDLSLTAENCTHSEETPCPNHYKNNGSCEYTRRINTFSNYKVVITNYHMMLALIKLRAFIPWHSPLIIWDEAHKFQDIVREMCTIEFNWDRCSRVSSDSLADDIYNLFLNGTGNVRVQDIYSELDVLIKLNNSTDTIQNKRYFERLKMQIDIYINQAFLKPTPYEKIYTRYVQRRRVEQRSKHIRLVPVDYTAFSKHTFATAADNFLMLSGTFHYPNLDVSDRLVALEKVNGMPMDTIYKTPSKYEFPKENILKILAPNLSSINYNNTARYHDFKNTYKDLIEFIIDHDKNTMIHFNAKRDCESMETALKEAGYTHKIYNFHGNGNTATSKQLIKKNFILTGGCLIGSSLHEGLDFPGEQLELVIVGRTPYAPNKELDKYIPGTRSKIESTIHKIWQGLKVRGLSDIEQEEYRLKLVQQIGRLQRSETDIGVVILCNEWAIDKSVKRGCTYIPIRKGCLRGEEPIKPKEETQISLFDLM